MSSIVRMADGPAPADLPAYNALPHVLLVVDGFPEALGGGERVLLRQAALLPAYGYRASILTLSWHPESSFQPPDAPCPVYLLPLQRTYDRQAMRGALDLRRFLRQEDICLVQTFFESSDLWAGAVVRLASPARLIWSRRDMGILRGRKHQVAYRWLRRLPHAVFAVSEQVKAHAIATDGIEERRVHTVYNGVDLAPSAATSADWLRTEPARIVTLGNIRRVKGHDVLIRAAAAVLRRRPEVVFEIAGEVLEPAYMAELQALLAELGIAQKVRFLGKVTDLGACLRSATLFVLPSRSEGFSNALVEAMAYGVPVVATDVGGNAEAVEHGVSGLIALPENVDSLSSAMLRMLDFPEEAAAMGAAGRKAALDRFSVDGMMRLITEVYGSLMSNSSVSPVTTGVITKD